MSRTRTRLILALGPALLVAGSVVAADEATGPTVVVEAADDPDVRASVTFPAGWRLEAAESGSSRSIDALAVDERCEVTTRRSDLPDLQTDVDDFEVSLGPGSGYIALGRESVELPAGTAERVDFALNEDGSRWSVYAAWDEGFVHELWCRGDELPEERWLAIAETLDIDPDPALSSSDFDPTTSRPDAGVAMAFGEEWHVRGSSTAQGLLYATSDTAVCALSDYSELAVTEGWGSVDAMHEAYVATVDARENISLEESAYLDLAAGRTGLADIAFDDGTRAIRYSFRDPARRTSVGLFCVGDPTPDDRYLSLAGSVTWLPAAD